VAEEDRNGVSPLDAAWVRANPLPLPQPGVDKNSRGRVLVLGGSVSVPGGVWLTAEAALRAGAGKVRIGTVEPVAMTMGVQFPEAGVLSLPVSSCGEIDASAELLEPHLTQFDAVVVGPAMSSATMGARLLETVLKVLPETSGLVIDAAALMSLGENRERLARRTGLAILTPHIGEMAAMLDCPAQDIEADRPGAAREAAERFQAITALKGSETLIAEPSGALHLYQGGNSGLATGGSGDVLAGIAGALLARGCGPFDAAGWAVWLHGEAGSRCAAAIGPLGYMARELLAEIPRVMHQAGQA
jgi:hydroxyethylthiazole kinase-like uncharacterized protein yjeF